MREQEFSPAGEPAPSRLLPLLVLLFIGSGCAALIYEIVWFQLLELVIGSSGVSLGVLLGTFMGGMCLGSVALPHVVSRRRHPLRVYALIELGIGALGLLVLYSLPLVDRLYVAGLGYGMPSLMLRAAVCAACLVPPTLLMGASLPAVARWVETSPRGVSCLGFFYGGNIAGAVLGCLLAGFYLLRVHDTAVATWVAAAANVTVALAGLALARWAPYRSAEEAPRRREASAPASRAVYVVIAASGLCALGAEVVWTRLLSLLLGATVYTFSIILAVFLAGLGLGSSAGAALSRRISQPAMALAGCQLLLCAAIAWTAYMISGSLPYWPVNPMLSPGPWFTFQLDVARAFPTIFPAACLWGASFPLALAAAAAPGQDPGRLVGRVYAANTVGAIGGAVGFSMILIPWIGTQQSERVLIAVSVLAGLLALLPRLRPLGVRAAAALASVLVAALLASSVSAAPWGLFAYGRRMLEMIGRARPLYVGEGMNASVAITEWNDGNRLFHVSGKTEASSEPHDMRLERMLGHLPALAHPNPRTVLVVGFGAGVTAGTFVLYPEVERIVICEMEPLIPKIASRYFRDENYDVLNDPRVEVIYDDARHYVLTTGERFDIITSDPIHPWVKGSATLYSREYFEMCRSRLNPGGVMSQWVPLYESDLRSVKSEMATFFDVFPASTVWGNDAWGEGYDVVLLGQDGPARLDVDAMEERLDREDYHDVLMSMFHVEFGSALDLLWTYAGQASDFREWLADAEINRDRNMRLQYLAGMALNLKQENAIFKEILSHARYPEGLFVASPERLAALEEMLGNPAN